jgi:hypothetical protein
MMITLLEEYETEGKLLKVRLYPCCIPFYETNKQKEIIK